MFQKIIDSSKTLGAAAKVGFNAVAEKVSDASGTLTEKIRDERREAFMEKLPSVDALSEKTGVAKSTIIKLYEGIEALYE